MDHVADVNLTTFHQINQQHELPGFVKAAAIDRTAIDFLPGSSFADPAHRRFPCHTRPDTFLSYAYFLKNANRLDATTRQVAWNNLRKFAHHWAIHLECEKLLREHEKQAISDLDQMPDEKFAIVEMWNDEKYRALPLLNRDCVKTAAEHLVEHKDRYPLEWRQHAAERVIKTAFEFNIEPPHLDYLQKAARYNTPAHGDIARGMLDRALLVNRDHRGDDEQLAMLKAARAMSGSNGQDLVQKAASIIDKFDQHYGLKRLYARGLLSPEEICFSSVTAKEARDLRGQLVQFTTGSTYTKVALEQAGLAPYRVLGEEFINAVRDGLSGVDIEKIAEIVPTLPLDDARLLDRALKAAQVKSAAQLQTELGVPASIDEWTRADWDKMIDKIAAPVTLGRMGGPKAGGPGGQCVCSKCGYTTAHTTATPCSQQKCPKCNVPLSRE